jgi:hypothetical protein
VAVAAHLSLAQPVEPPARRALNDLLAVFQKLADDDPLVLNLASDAVGCEEIDPVEHIGFDATAVERRGQGTGRGGIVCGGRGRVGGGTDDAPMFVPVVMERGREARIGQRYTSHTCARPPAVSPL